MKLINTKSYIMNIYWLSNVKAIFKHKLERKVKIQLGAICHIASNISCSHSIFLY